MKSIFFLLIFSFSLFAVDVSNFDIKRMTLRDSYNMILKKIPCTPQKHTWKTENGKISGYQLVCEDYSYVINFNRYKKIINIEREKKFDTQPNFDKVYQQVIKKYGKPTIKAYKSPGSNNPNRGFIRTMCWGTGCELKQEEDSSVATGTDIEMNWINKGFFIRYRKWSESSSDAGTLHFWLENSKRKKENSDWENNENKKYRQKQLENEKDAVDL